MRKIRWCVPVPSVFQPTTLLCSSSTHLATNFLLSNSPISIHINISPFYGCISLPGVVIFHQCSNRQHCCVLLPSPGKTHLAPNFLLSVIHQLSISSPCCKSSRGGYFQLLFGGKDNFFCHSLHFPSVLGPKTLRLGKHILKWANSFHQLSPSH